MPRPGTSTGPTEIPPISATKIRLGISTASTRPNGRADTNIVAGARAARDADTRLIRLDTPRISAM